MAFLAAPPESQNKASRRSSVAAHGRTTSRLPEGYPSHPQQSVQQSQPHLISSPVAAAAHSIVIEGGHPSPTAAFDPLTSPSTRSRLAQQSSVSMHLPAPPSPAPFQPIYSSPDPFGQPMGVSMGRPAVAAPVAVASSTANPFDIFGPSPSVAAHNNSASPVRQTAHSNGAAAFNSGHAFDPFATLPSSQPRATHHGHAAMAGYGGAPNPYSSPFAPQPAPQPAVIPVAANPFDIFGDFGKPMTPGTTTPVQAVARPQPQAAPTARAAVPKHTQEDEGDDEDDGALASMKAAAAVPAKTAAASSRVTSCMNECGGSATIECAQCHQALCASCDDVLHRKAAMRGHNRRAVLTARSATAAAAATPTTAASTARPTSASPNTTTRATPQSTPNGTTRSLSVATNPHQSPAAAKRMTEIQVDVLAYMKKGTPFLKYGSFGYPHFRQFQISDDNSKLMWFSSNKKMKDTQIDIDNIDALQLGQTTANFARHKAPELAKSSFSLIYDRRRKTLDLIAKDPNEYKIWTEGLKHLIERARDHRSDVGEIKQLVVSIPVLRGRRSSVDIVDFNSGKNADVLGGGDEEKQAPSRPTGNKQAYKEVAEGFNKLKVKISKQKEQLRDSIYINSSQYDNLINIVKRVDASIQKIAEWFQNGEYGACDDEVWRAGVDCESLGQMMSAIRP